MTGIKIIRDGEGLPESLPGTVATIGVFDGVHLGHQGLIALVVDKAKSLGLYSAIVTFDQHPTQVTSPQNAPKTLTKLDRKLELFQENGIDYVYLIKFDQKRSETKAVKFFEQVFVAGVNAKFLYVGEDFQFGYRKEGDVALLKEEGKKNGISVLGIPLIQDHVNDDVPISSTAIRKNIESGEILLANIKLGRMFELQGKVITGDGRGRSIGFPTANLAVSEQLIVPGEGVYAAWYEREDSSRVKAAVNIGRRPTFEENAQISSIEAHLLDFDEDLYGEIGRLLFVQRIREERKFSGVQEFQNQLKADISAVREILNQ
ncbi:MAG: bifunctional riboflavin kinase/FAD synthetase [Actinomycetota bacterium]